MALKNVNVFPIFISLLSVVISGVSLAIVLSRSTDLGVDYMGLIVGVLALLITILIGWNIYNAIDFRENEKRLESKISKAEQDIALSNLRSDCLNYHTFADLYLNLRDTPAFDAFKYMNLSIMAAQTAYAMGDYGFASARVKGLLSSIVDLEKTGMSERQKELLLQICYKIKNPALVSGLDELMTLLNRR